MTDTPWFRWQDCAAIKGTVQMLEMLTNLSRMEFACITAASKSVPTHRDLQAQTFAGFFKLADGDGPIVLDQGLPGLVSALDFGETSGDHLKLTLMHNASRYRKAVAPERVMSTLNHIIKAFVAQRLGSTVNDGPPMLVGVKDFPMVAPWGIPLDIGSGVGAFLITFVFLIMFPMIVVTYVQEKVSNIRIMMKMMGLDTVAYFSIMYAFWLAMSVAFFMIFLLVVNVSQLPSGYRIGMFAHVNFGVQFVFFLLYSLANISFAFLWGSAIRSIRVAQIATICWILVTITLSFLLVSMVFGTPGTPSEGSDAVPEGVKAATSLVPTMALIRGLAEFVAYANSSVVGQAPSLEFSGLSADAGTGSILVIWVCEAIGFLALALYIDQVVDSGVGVAKHPLFFLGVGRTLQDPPSDGNDGASGATASGALRTDGALRTECASSSARPPPSEDVVAEAARVRALEGLPRLLQDAVVTKGLRKTFPGTPPKKAVRSLDLGIRRGECFGLLGPNGAGKTTSINMLVGFFRPSAGDATVEGLSIRTKMESIHALMGVCPQHNLLWDTLTAREHLAFYGTLKNLKGPALAAAVREALEAVKRESSSLTTYWSEST